MRRSDRTTRTRLAVALAVSLVVNLVLLREVALVFTAPLEPGAPPAASRPLDSVAMSDVLSEQELSRLLQAPPPTLPEPDSKEKPPEPPPPPERLAEGQVVEIPRPEQEEIPDDTPLVSDWNSKVDREQLSNRREAPTPEMHKADERVISRGDDPDGNTRDAREASRDRADERPKGDPSKTGSAERPSEQLGVQTERPEITRKIARQDTQDADLQPGAGPFFRGVDPPEEVRRRFGGDGPAGGSASPGDYRSLLPTLGPEEQRFADGSIDHVEDIERGEVTALNTREYKYAHFFNRVKRAVQRHWRPGASYRRRDPSGRVHGFRDRITVVEVTLNPDGSLEEIFLQRDSGVAFLDEVAIQAFRAAQPFPNPPNGLLDDDGQIRFKFGFYLEFNRGGLRLFRYQ